MNRNFIVYGAALGGLAAFSLFAGWLFFDATTLSDGSRTLGPVWRDLAGAAILAAGVIGFLAALAFYSATRGFDDRRGEDLSPPKS
jgi:hypothetical protein